MNKLLKKINESWAFLLIVIMMYMIVAIVDPAIAERALCEFISIFTKVIPTFILVFVLMFLSYLLLDAKKVSVFLGEKAGIKGWAISFVGGIISTGPIYMWYPLLADLKEKGMKDGFIATFLYNRAVKIPMIPFSILYFGLPFTVVLTMYMALFSIINGILVEKILNITYNKRI